MLQLILAMNRDEFVNRPTSPACVRGGLLAGWDEQPGREGGTWLALDTVTGRLGVSTESSPAKCVQVLTARVVGPVFLA